MSDRLAELKAKRAQREAEAAARRAAAELEELELEDKFSVELGPRGNAFEIIDLTELGEGFVVVKLGEAVLHKAFKAALDKPKGATDADIHAYVSPQVVHPSKEKYSEISARRDGVALRCANAVASLHGGRTGLESGKY